MTDEEVGALWRESLDNKNRPYGTTRQAIVQSLIRKLVDERCYRSKLPQALRDFYIDPETWGK
jgi:hypothetical protein